MARLIFLDGLRGVAALIVVISHFVVGFFPMLHFKGNFNSYGYTPFVEQITNSPIIILFSGNLAVCIFFCLSGFVLSVGLIESKNQIHLLSLLIKRYVRLLIPIITSVFFACYLLKNGYIYNQVVGPLTQSAWLTAFYHIEPSWLYALKSGMLVPFFSSYTMYNAVLWTMPYEFLGSCIIFLILAIRAFFSNTKEHASILVGMYVFFAVVFLNTYFLCFIVGMVYAEIYIYQGFIKINRIRVIGIILGAIYFGSYPSDLVASALYLPLDTIMNFIPSITISKAVFFHIISASLFLFLALNCTVIKTLLSSTICQFLGRISFSMYLVHLPIICSFSSFLYLLLTQWGPFNHISAFLTTIILSFPVIIVVSILFSHIDELAVHLSRKLQRFIDNEIMTNRIIQRYLF